MKRNFFRIAAVLVGAQLIIGAGYAVAGMIEQSTTQLCKASTVGCHDSGCQSSGGQCVRAITGCYCVR